MIYPIAETIADIKIKNSLQDINKSKCKKAIESMGSFYLLHPSNTVQRKTPFTRTPESLRSGLGIDIR